MTLLRPGAFGRRAGEQEKEVVKEEEEAEEQPQEETAAAAAPDYTLVRLGKKRGGKWAVRDVSFQDAVFI